MDEALIARHAAAHHGVLTSSVLAEVGLSAGQVRRRVKRGEWKRVHRGVYLIAASPQTFEMLATAALFALPSAVLSHRSAGRVLGVGTWEAAIELTLRPGAASRLSGTTIHQAGLPDSHVVRRRGFRCTRVERTLIDLAAVLSLNEIQRCVEDQLVAQRTTPARLEDMFGQMAQRGRPGIARMRRVLSELDGQPPTESELEARFLRLLTAHGLLLPERQAQLAWLPSERGRVDFWYPEQLLVVDLDGRKFHARSMAFEADRHRDQLALINGVRTVRFTHRQLQTESGHVVSVMRRLVG